MGGAAVGLRRCADDGQAEPGPAGIVAATGASVIKAGEPVEGPLPVGLWIPGPSSVTVSSTHEPEPPTETVTDDFA